MAVPFLSCTDYTAMLYCDLYDCEVEVDMTVYTNSKSENKIVRMEWSHPITWAKLHTGYKSDDRFDMEQFWWMYKELEEAALEYVERKIKQTKERLIIKLG